MIFSILDAVRKVSQQVRDAARARLVMLAWTGLAGSVMFPCAIAQQPLANSTGTLNYPVALSINTATGEVYVLNSDYSLQYLNGSSDQQDSSCAASSGLMLPAPLSPPSIPGLPQGVALAVDPVNKLVLETGASTAQSPDPAVLSVGATAGSCAPSAVAVVGAAQNLSSLVAVDSARKKFYAVNQFNGSATDSLEVVSTASSPYAVASFPLDNNAQYSGIAVDPASGYVFVSESSNSSGNLSLFLYNPSNETVTQVIGPAGESIPAVAIFSVPNPANTQYGQLVVVGVTPPAPGMSPVVVLDTSQMQATGGTFTIQQAAALPQESSYNFVIAATLDPQSSLLYLVGASKSGSGSSATIGGPLLLSYDPKQTTQLSEESLADLSAIPFSLPQSYPPTLVFDGALKSVYLLNKDPNSTAPLLDLYQIGAAAGALNQTSRVTAQMAGDAKFSPLQIAVDARSGKLYVLSSDYATGAYGAPGLADNRLFVFDPPPPPPAPSVLTLTAPSTVLLGQPVQVGVTLTSSGTGTPTGSISLQGTLGGSPIILDVFPAWDAFGDQGSLPASVRFAAAGTYSIVASYPGDGIFGAATSQPSTVQVGKAETSLTLTGSGPYVAGTDIPLKVGLTTAESSPTGEITLSATETGSSGTVQLGSVMAASASAGGG
jgi:hypothetical protein